MGVLGKIRMNPNSLETLIKETDKIRTADKIPCPFRPGLDCVGDRCSLFYDNTVNMGQVFFDMNQGRLKLELELVSLEQYLQNIRNVPQQKIDLADVF